MNEMYLGEFEGAIESYYYALLNIDLLKVYVFIILVAVADIVDCEKE